MKDDYDFSKADRGRFHRSGAIFSPPVHLDPEALALLTARAGAQRVARRTRQCAGARP